MSDIRWDLFDSAVNAANLVCRNEDIARDAALLALEELGADATAATVSRRARDRAKDMLRTAARRAPTVSLDMDLLPSASIVEDEAAASEGRVQLRAAIGDKNMSLLDAKAAGYSNAEIAVQHGYSEEKARLMVNAAELARQVFNDTRA
jgi:hypothetical protein